MIDAELAALQDVVVGLSEGLGDRLIAIVLFGSRARGDHHPESDWDLLIIADELPRSPLDRRMSVLPYVPLHSRGSLSLLLRTREEFEARLSPLYLDIALDGRILYDPTGYAAERLATINDILQRRGLYRRRTDAGNVWEWHDPPKGYWSVEWDS